MKTWRNRIVLRLTWAERACAWAVLFVGMFNSPNFPETTLDPSWRVTLSYAFHAGMQFGKEIIFTYGPLGFLMGNTYDGSHLWELVAWQAIKSAAFAAIVIWAVARLPAWGRGLGYAVIVLFGLYFEDTLHLAIIAMVCLGALRDPEVIKPRTMAAIAAGLAVLGLIKFTSLLLAGSGICFIALKGWSVGRPRVAIAAIVGFAMGFFVLWLLAGQNPANIPRYFLNSWRITYGYEQAMGLAAPTVSLWKAGAVLALMALLLLVSVGGGGWARHRMAAGFLVVYTYLTWKHGFIRADGHMGGFFIGMMLVTVPVLALVPITGMRRWCAGATIALLVGVAIWGLDEAFTIHRGNVFREIAGKFSDRWDRVKRWQSFAANYRGVRDELCFNVPLERIRAIVGDGTIDVLGYEAAIVCFHGMNYRPRPVIQSYSAYTPELAQLNRDYFTGPRAPQFVLQRLQTVDERLLTLDDGRLLPLLPRCYQCLLAEDGYLLWRRRDHALGGDGLAPGVLREGRLKMGETLELNPATKTPLWLELEIPPSLLGRMRSAAYQPPIVKVRVTEADGRAATYRLPPLESASGFIVSPVVDDAAGYLSMVSGETRRPVKAVGVLIDEEDRKFFRNGIGFRVRAVELPEPDSALAAAVRRVKFHMFRAVPVSESAFIPYVEETIDGVPVMIAHAPSEMRFRVPPGMGKISGKFGFTPGAYMNGGQTDGATFAVLASDGTGTHVIFSRYLDPATKADDRGLQFFGVEVPVGTSEILLRVDPGPKNINSWDWTAWTAVEFGK